MSANAVKDTKKVIALAVLKNRPDIIALFKKNGVMVSKSWSDHELITGILSAMNSNVRFKEDLKVLLTKVTEQNQTLFTGENMFNKFTGENMFRFTGESMFHIAGTGAMPSGKWRPANGLAASGPSDAELDDWLKEGGYSDSEIKNTYSGSSAAAPKKNGLLSSVNVGNLLNTGVNTLSSLLVNKSNKQLANTALEIEREKTQQAALLAQAGGGAGGAQKPGLSTGATVGIVIGSVVLLSLVVWGVVALSKKKKS